MERLSANDAILTVTIQTSNFGFPTGLGQINFLPNGGPTQSGCSYGKHFKVHFSVNQLSKIIFYLKCSPQFARISKLTRI